jgi:hypothetical protein
MRTSVVVRLRLAQGSDIGRHMGVFTFSLMKNTRLYNFVI